MLQQARFLHQFAALLKAGFSTQQSLDMAGNDCNPTFQAYLRSVSQQIATGRDLAASLSIGKTPFDPWTISLIRAADYSGALPEACERLAIAYENKQKQNRLFRSTLISCAVVALALFIWLHILIPKESLFLLWLFVILIAAFLAVQTNTSGDFISALYRSGIRVGPIKKIVEVRSLLYLAELELPLRCGIPILQALDLIRKRLPDPELANSLAIAMREIQTGKTLSQSLTGRISPLALQMIRTGEETGNLDEMLGKVAEYYEGELERQLKHLQNTLRALGILAAGSIVLLLGIKTLQSIFNALPS